MIFAISITSSAHAQKAGDESMVCIRTTYGDIKVRLYDKTPAHKKNFIKLIEEGFYSNLLFHRVIENFMIQGGDPDSKNAQSGERLGGGSPGYTLPAEFVPEYFHKRGAIAAARLGGSSNPEKRSSGSQFYIVQGKVHSQGMLDTLEMIRNNRIKKEIFQREVEAAQDELMSYKKNNDREGYSLKVAEIRMKTDSLARVNNPEFKFSKDQREIYSTIGGYPSLDGDYTVFGEVVEGMEIVDKIAGVKTDKNNRPLEDIRFEILQTDE